MTPNIQKEKLDKDLKLVKIHKLLSDEYIDNNISEFEITKDDIKLIKESKYGRMKFKEITFDEIILGNLLLNKYGNINLINCIFILNQKKKSYFKHLFTKFNIEKGEFEIKNFKNGKNRKLLFDNKILKNSLFLHPSDKNFWIYILEKSIAKSVENYVNTIPLLASDIFKFITPYLNKVYNHQVVNKKEFYEILKETIKTKTSFIIYGEKDILSNEFFDKNNYISFFITNVFKVNGRKYVELYLPYNRDSQNNIIKFQHYINEEDIKNTKFFPEENLKNENLIYYKFDHYFKHFDNTYILNFNPSYYFESKTIILSDSNINLLKFKLEKKTKISLIMTLPHTLLFRFVLAKLIVTENYIRRIRTMSSEYNESNSYYTDEIDYNFEYINSQYSFGNSGIIETELKEGIYSLLFNVYSNSQVKISIGAISNNKIEFLDIAEKISEEKLNSQIKSLFISFLKLNPNKNVKTNDIYKIKNCITYESLINENLGYSIYAIENNTEEQNISLSLFTENDGMNIITKDYCNDIENINDLNCVKIIISPKNTELIVFEWEKTIDQIYINIYPKFEVTKIESMYKEEIFWNLPKKYIGKSEVYYIEMQYRRGAFLIFVNESLNDSYIIKVKFDKCSNLEYKGFRDEMIENKNINIEIKNRNYMDFNLKAIEDGDFSYSISLVLQKVNKNEINNKEKEEDKILISGNDEENNSIDNKKEKEKEKEEE